MNIQQPVRNDPWSSWREVFSCDLRSLAVFRIALGAILLIDLGMRFSCLEAMYTDAGIYTVAEHTSYQADIANTKNADGWSLHALSGSAEWQIALFVVAAIAAGMLMVGWQTKLAAIVSWVLLVSIQSRNPLIIHSGDILMKLLLFWTIFLPVSRIWSLDARRQTEPPSSLRYFSPATVGIIMVMFSLYFFPGIAKCNRFWFDGIAMDYVLRLDIYSTGLGDWMLQYPLLLKLICWVTVIGEIAVPFLLFVPWHTDRCRMIALLFFCGLHLSIAVVMSIGLFCYTAFAAWSALLPGSFWESRWVTRLLPFAATDRVVASFGSRQQSSPPDSRSKWRSGPWGSLGRILANGFAVFFISYSLWWHISNINHPMTRHLMPRQAYVIGKWMNMKQGFLMFDVPPQHSPWFVYEARLMNGDKVDIFRGQPVTHERPESVLKTIPGHHWRRVHRNLVSPGFKRFRDPIARYVVEQWNKTHSQQEQVDFMRFYAYLDEIGPNYNGTDQVRQVWSHIGNPAALDKDLFDNLMRQLDDKGEILP